MVSPASSAKPRSSSTETSRSRSRRTQRRTGPPWPLSSKIVVRVTLAVAASCWADATLVTIAPVSGSRRGHSRLIRPSNRARSLASGSQTSTTARPPGARWSASARSAARWAARVGSTSSELRAMNARPNRGSPGRRRPTMSASTRVRRSSPAFPLDPLARPSEHGRVDVDAGDLVAGLGQRDGQPPAPDCELEDRAVGAVGQREVEVEVARVVDEVEVVQAREGGRGRGVGSIERGVDGVSPPSAPGRRRDA